MNTIRTILQNRVAKIRNVGEGPRLDVSESSGRMWLVSRQFVDGLGGGWFIMSCT